MHHVIPLKNTVKTCSNAAVTLLHPMVGIYSYKDFSEASHSLNSSQNEESEQSFESNDTINYSQNNSYIDNQEQSSSECTVKIVL